MILRGGSFGTLRRASRRTTSHRSGPIRFFLLSAVLTDGTMAASIDAAIVPSVSTALSKKKRMGPLRWLVVRRDARLSVPNEPPLKIILADQTHSPRGVVFVKEGQQCLIHGLDPVAVVVRSRRRRTAPVVPISLRRSLRRASAAEPYHPRNNGASP